MNDTLSEILKVASPILLAILALILNAVKVAVEKYLASLTAEKAVAEAVLATEQTMRASHGEQKLANARALLEDDPRVGTVSLAAIEAAVATLPKGGE